MKDQPTFSIPGELPDLNTYINTERGNKYAAAAMKADATALVCQMAQYRRVQKVHQPVVIEIHWLCRDKKKDPDNIAFAKKFIMDGLVLAGILEGDGWKNVLSFTDKFEVSKEPRIDVYIYLEKYL